MDDTIGRLYAGAPTSYAQPAFAAGKAVHLGVSTTSTPQPAALPAGAGSVAAVAAVPAAAALAVFPAVALAQAVGVAAEAAVRHPSTRPAVVPARTPCQPSGSAAAARLHQAVFCGICGSHPSRGQPQPTPQPAVLLQSSLPLTLNVPSSSAAVLRLTDSRAAAHSFMQLPDELPSVAEIASSSKVHPTVVDPRVRHLLLQLQREVMQQSARTESVVQQTLVCAQQQQMRQQQQTAGGLVQQMADLQQVLLQQQL